MAELDNETDETAASFADAAAPAETAEAFSVNSDDANTVIRDTDIVFDCPHCGHNLAIDYRGAGLQINCVKCGESVLVPIPDGMKIDDLDLDPGELHKQLFAARRNLHKAEERVNELEQRLARVNDFVKLISEVVNDDAGADGE